MKTVAILILALIASLSGGHLIYEVAYAQAAAEVAAAGVAPGTECSLSTMSVKIVARDRVVGVVLVESFEREYAFGETEIRLLQTIVGEMGVALENARLFDEAQWRTRESAAQDALRLPMPARPRDDKPVHVHDRRPGGNCLLVPPKHAEGVREPGA